MVSPESKTRVALMHSPELEAHHYPENHPFRPERAGMVRKTLASLGLLSGADRCEVAPEPADREALTAFHTPEYLDALKKGQEGELDVAMMHMGIGLSDNPVFKGMYDYAALACGASLMGAQLLLDGEAGIAFNPSGGYHHAHAAQAAGFCYINDVALA